MAMKRAALCTETRPNFFESSPDEDVFSRHSKLDDTRQTLRFNNLCGDTRFRGEHSLSAQQINFLLRPTSKAQKYLRLAACPTEARCAV